MLDGEGDSRMRATSYPYRSLPAGPGSRVSKTTLRPTSGRDSLNARQFSLSSPVWTVREILTFKEGEVCLVGPHPADFLDSVQIDANGKVKRLV